MSKNLKPKNYESNPHFKPIKSNLSRSIVPKQNNLFERFSCYDHLNKSRAKCSVFNEQILRTDVNRLKVNNYSPISITVLINDNSVANIPSGQTMYLDRATRNSLIEVDDLIAAIDENNNLLFSHKIIQKQHEHVLDVGLAQFLLHAGHADTSLVVHNFFDMPFEVWCGKKNLGTIKGKSNTKIEIFREGFKEGIVLYLRTDSGHQYTSTIPKIPYGKHAELYVGSSSNFY